MPCSGRAFSPAVLWTGFSVDDDTPPLLLCAIVARGFKRCAVLWSHSLSHHTFSSVVLCSGPTQCPTILSQVSCYALVRAFSVLMCRAVLWSHSVSHHPPHVSCCAVLWMPLPSMCRVILLWSHSGSHHTLSTIVLPSRVLPPLSATCQY